MADLVVWCMVHLLVLIVAVLALLMVVWVLVRASCWHGLLVGDVLVVAGLGPSRRSTLFHLSSCPWGVALLQDCCFHPLPSLMVLQAYRLSTGMVWKVFGVLIIFWVN